MSEYTKSEEIRIPTPYGHIAGKVWGEPGAKPILGHIQINTLKTYLKYLIMFYYFGMKGDCFLLLSFETCVS